MNFSNIYFISFACLSCLLYLLTFISTIRHDGKPFIKVLSLVFTLSYALYIPVLVITGIDPDKPTKTQLIICDFCFGLSCMLYCLGQWEFTWRYKKVATVTK